MATDDKVSIIVTSTDTNGATKQKSFTYISPDATNGQLKAFAQAANALTENTYNGSKKVTQVDLDTAVSKQTATITLSESTIALADLKSAILSNGIRIKDIQFSYDGDGTPHAFSNDNDVAAIGVSVFFNTSQQAYWLTFYGASNERLNSLTTGFTVTVRADETDTYKAAEATYTVTV